MEISRAMDYLYSTVSQIEAEQDCEVFVEKAPRFLESATRIKMGNRTVDRYTLTFHLEFEVK